MSISNWLSASLANRHVIHVTCVWWRKGNDRPGENGVSSVKNSLVFRKVFRPIHYSLMRSVGCLDELVTVKVTPFGAM